jgi:ABC-type transport system involved in multi-copper enzyme maturation permease subunit
MEARSKRLWVVTLANVAVAFLLLLSLYGIMLALAVIAPEISGWPLYILLPLGVALSVVGLMSAKTVASRWSRRIAYLANGGALAFDLLMIFGFAALFISSTKERFLIPDGYKGDVYVVYNAPDGEPLAKTRWAVTYRIPKDGVLRVQGVMTRTWTRTEYDYQMDTGNLKRIRNFWPTTIHPTPENLANDRDVGVFFPRSGTFTDPTGCSVEYQQFYVGTKAHLLGKYQELDLYSYLQKHPAGCLSQPK